MKVAFWSNFILVLENDGNDFEREEIMDLPSRRSKLNIGHQNIGHN
jgi:hypothetical protein